MTHSPPHLPSRLHRSASAPVPPNASAAHVAEGVYDTSDVPAPASAASDVPAPTASGDALRRRIARAYASIFLLLLLFFPQAAPSAIRDALTSCASSLIPTVFPLLVLTRFLTDSNLLSCDSSKPAPLPLRLLGFGRQGGRLLILSLLAGYPHAAYLASVARSRGEIGEDEADRLCAVATLPSPSLLMIGIGAPLMGSMTRGLALWGVLILASLLTAIALRMLFPPAPVPLIQRVTPPTPPILPTLARSIRESALAMAGICGCALFFSALRGLAASILPPALLPPVSGFLEINPLMVELARSLPRHRLPPLLALLLASSGCAIHAQTALFASGQFRLRLYPIGRLLCCLLSPLLALLLL